MSHADYWLRLKATDIVRYRKLAKQSRYRHAGKVRQRTRNWKQRNRERYNAYRRELYRRRKEQHGKKES